MKGVYDPGAWQREPIGFIGAGIEDEAVPDAAAIRLCNEVRLLPDGKILDVGCCDGRYARWLNQRLPGGLIPEKYIGVDITPAFVERARSRSPEYLFQVGDVRALEFPDRSFMNVICPNVLMHVPDLKGCLAELCRVAIHSVVVSVYGADEELGDFQTHDQNFLNYWYTWGTFVSCIPTGFKDIRAWGNSPTWDTGMKIFQFTLQRDG
jgi:ubiquinone/menaquinone biosynthesis C-methylase UbiE